MLDRAAFLASVKKPNAGFVGVWKNIEGRDSAMRSKRRKPAKRKAIKMSRRRAGPMAM